MIIGRRKPAPQFQREPIAPKLVAGEDYSRFRHHGIASHSSPAFTPRSSKS